MKNKLCQHLPGKLYRENWRTIGQLFLMGPTLHNSIDSNERKGVLCHNVIVWNNSVNSLEEVRGVETSWRWGRKARVIIQFSGGGVFFRQIRQKHILNSYTLNLFFKGIGQYLSGSGSMVLETRGIVVCETLRESRGILPQEMFEFFGSEIVFSEYYFRTCNTRRTYWKLPYLT